MRLRRHASTKFCAAGWPRAERDGDPMATAATHAPARASRATAVGSRPACTAGTVLCWLSRLASPPPTRLAGGRPVAYHHVALATRDLDATHRFYTEVMGFELAK